MKCGFVTIVGVPNAGKSTLVNQLVGSKVSIVSSKVQTTRRRILGVVMHEDSQIVLVDTPGIFEPKKRLEKAMVAAAWSAIEGTDLLLIIADATASSQESTLALIDKLKASNIPIWLVINKIDKCPRADLLPLISALTHEKPIQKTYLISALMRDGLEALLNDLNQAMPTAPWHFPEDQLSDLPQRLLAAEITREKIFQFLHQELPYSVTVEGEKWENFANGDIKISQVIYVMRESQRRILLGKGGQQIKKIGEAARRDLQEILGARVHLFLHVQVAKDWTEKRHHYEEMGLEFKTSE